VRPYIVLLRHNVAPELLNICRITHPDPACALKARIASMPEDLSAAI